MKDSEGYPKISGVWASPPGEGFQLELACQIAGQTTYFARFLADCQDESVSLELTVQGQPIRIPVDRLEELISAAKKDVHSETWYDNNPPLESGS
jgi:hypothetical protein